MAENLRAMRQEAAAAQTPEDPKAALDKKLNLAAISKNEEHRRVLFEIVAKDDPEQAVEIHKKLFDAESSKTSLAFSSDELDSIEKARQTFVERMALAEEATKEMTMENLGEAIQHSPAFAQICKLAGTDNAVAAMKKEIGRLALEGSDIPKDILKRVHELQNYREGSEYKQAHDNLVRTAQAEGFSIEEIAKAIAPGDPVKTVENVQQMSREKYGRVMGWWHSTEKTPAGARLLVAAKSFAETERRLDVRIRYIGYSLAAGFLGSKSFMNQTGAPPTAEGISFMNAVVRESLLGKQQKNTTESPATFKDAQTKAAELRNPDFMRQRQDAWEQANGPIKGADDAATKANLDRFLADVGAGAEGMDTAAGSRYTLWTFLKFIWDGFTATDKKDEYLRNLNSNGKIV